MTTLYRTDSTAVPQRAKDLFGSSKLDDMGSDKYNTTKIAARIRADIKTAISEGLIRKGVKVSVRKRDHNCIYLEIKKAPFILQNPKAIIERKEISDMDLWKEDILQKETQTILNIFSLIERQYNWNNSNAMEDYFDVNFYCYPSIDSGLEYAERDGILAMAAQGLTVKAAA